MTQPPTQYECPCCGQPTLGEEPAYAESEQEWRRPVCTYTRAQCSAAVHRRHHPVQQCGVCGWVSDFHQEHDVQLHGQPNGVNLLEAQDNYQRIGVIHSGALASVRP